LYGDAIDRSARPGFYGGHLQVFQWKREMSEAERAEFALYAGDTLEELEYKV
jgi:hypothetical protein